jgi:hypothetical protein
MLLEKRVKSRFSHRMIDFYPCKSFEDFTTIAQNSLLLPGNAKKGPIPLFNNAVQVYFSLTNQELFEHNEVIQILKDMYETSNSVPQLLKLSSFVIQQLSEESPTPILQSFSHYEDPECIDQRTLTIHGILNHKQRIVPFRSVFGYCSEQTTLRIITNIQL